jgi:hypothetical protein
MEKVAPLNEWGLRATSSSAEEVREQLGSNNARLTTDSIDNGLDLGFNDTCSG